MPKDGCYTIKKEACFIDYSSLIFILQRIINFASREGYQTI